MTTTTKPMLAFVNTRRTKAEVMAQLQAHHDADEIVQGRCWENGQGCAVGCTIHGSNHQPYETEFGIPAHLAHLEDSIFERLPLSVRKEWPLRFMGAVREGSDLTMVWPRFAVWLLTEQAPSEPGAIVADLYRKRISGNEPTENEWGSAVEGAAWAAAGAAWAAGAAEAAEAAGAQADKLIELIEEAP